MKRAKTIALALVATLLVLALALPATAWWLIASESGNAQLLARLPGLIGAQIEVGARKGGLLGPLEWNDVRYEDDSVRVTVRHLVLKWQPRLLLGYRVAVDDLQVDGLEVRLKDSQKPPKPPSGKPPLTHLPVDIVVRHLGVADFGLWTVGADKPVAVPRAAFAGSWLGDRVRVGDLDLDYPGVGRLQAQANARLTEKGVQVDKLSVLSPAVVAARGFVAYQGASDLELGWQDLRWPLATAPDDTTQPLVTSSRGEVTLKGPWKDLQFTLAAALGPRGHVDAQGRWNGELDAKVDWTQLGWPLVVDNAPVQSAKGSLAAKGLPEHYSFDLAADLLAQDKAGSVSARGSGSLQSVNLEAFSAAIGKGSIQAAGPVAWAPQPSGALHGRIQKFDPGLFAAAWPGDINGEFSVDGELAGGKQPALRFNVKLADSKLRNYPLKLDVQGQYARQQLDIARLELHSGGSQLKASGRASEPYDVKAEIDSKNLTELMPGLAGSAHLKAAFQGTPLKPQLQASGELPRVSFHEYAATAVKIDADLDWNGPITLAVDARELAVGVPLHKLELRGQGTRGDHRLSLAVESTDGQASLELAGGYDEKAQRWAGRLDQGRIAPVRLRPWVLQAPAELALSAQQNDLGSACWDSDPGRVCLEAHQNPKDTRAQVQVEQFAFAYFASLLPDELKLDGTLSGVAAVELAGGQLRQAQVDLATTEGTVQLRDKRVVLKPGRLKLSDSEAGGEAELRLPLDLGGIEADARLAPGALTADRALSGELRIDFPDLGFLTIVTSEIAAASGQLAGRYTLAGRVGAPEIQGEATLTNGRLKLTRPGIEITDLRAVVAGDPSGHVSLNAQARSGEGELSIEGRVERVRAATLRAEKAEAARDSAAEHAEILSQTQAAGAAAGAPAVPDAPAPAAPAEAATPAAEAAPQTGTRTRLTMTVKGSNFQAANLPQARVWISPDLSFDLDGQQAALKGTLQVPRAEILLQQGENSGVGPSGDQVIVNAAGEAPEKAEAGLALSADVKVSLGDRVHLEGFGLKTQLEGEVTAVEQPGRDTLGFGELRLVDGRYKAYGQDLQIETGRLLFNGGPIAKPGLEIRASRKQTEDVTVGLYVRGTLDKPQLSLFSEPAMTQQQQLSWLLFGRPLEQSSSSQDRSQLNGAAVALGLGGGSLLASSFQKGLGLDEISLGSDPGETNEQARLTVGKYLSPKIFVSYGIGLFQPGQVFKLLYDLGRGFKLSTESGTYTGGDLLYTVETR